MCDAALQLFFRRIMLGDIRIPIFSQTTSLIRFKILGGWVAGGGGGLLCERG